MFCGGMLSSFAFLVSVLLWLGNRRQRFSETGGMEREVRGMIFGFCNTVVDVVVE